MNELDGEKPFWASGLRFSCTSCGHCCRHEPGYVFLSEEDLAALADHRGIGREAFVAKYCRSVDLGIALRLSLNETSGNDCVFWSGGCTVYEARPLQCRSYPFWPAVLASREDWDREAAECPGMNHGVLHDAEEISAALAERERRTLISPKR